MHARPLVRFLHIRWRRPTCLLLQCDTQHIDAGCWRPAALDAPAFRDFEDPERYLLAALVYKDLCHFDAAIAAVTV